MRNVEPGTPTQVAHPWRALLRTFVAAGVGIAVAWTARVLGIDLTGLEVELVNSISLGVWGLVTAGIQWLLSHPRLQDFLSLLRLSTGVEKETFGKYEAGRPVAVDEGDDPHGYQI